VKEGACMKKVIQGLKRFMLHVYCSELREELRQELIMPEGLRIGLEPPESIIENIMENITIERAGSFVWVYDSGTWYCRNQLSKRGFIWCWKIKKWVLIPKGYKKRSDMNYSHCQIQQIYDSKFY
jgi:hypothetical protein